MSCSPSSIQPEGMSATARQHAPLRRVLPKSTVEASASVAQHRADHPLLFASASLQLGHGICSSASPTPFAAAAAAAAAAVVQQRVSLPIQPKKASPSPPQQQSAATGTASSSSLADSCYSSCSDGEQQQQQQHLLLSSETSDCSTRDDGAGSGLAEELRQRAALREDAGGGDGRRTMTASRQNEAAAPMDAQLLEFATRLGYTEDDLRTVLQQLGSGGTEQPLQRQDLVLSELIKLERRQTHTAQQRTAPAAAQPQQHNSKLLRPIVVDGSNIAMAHGNKTVFSCGGIRECVQFFVRRGHTDILVFVPHFRREQPRPDSPIVDQHILLELEAERRLVWTPSRRMGGRRIVCHDDRYILKTAAEKQAVIVSNDEYRDLVRENPRWRAVVENLLLMYSFVDGKFMPPDDPLGRRGPKLDQFLTFAHTPLNAQLCPYAKKCTYGNKCKFFHPERINGVWISAADRLASRVAGDVGGTENAKQLLAARPSLVAEHSQRQNACSLLPTTARHNNVGRTRSLNCGGGPLVGLAAAAAAQIGDQQQQQRNQQQRDEDEQTPMQSTKLEQHQHKLLLHPPLPHHAVAATGHHHHLHHQHLPLLRFESSPAVPSAGMPSGSVAAVALSPVPPVAVAAQHHQSLARILSAPAPSGGPPPHHQLHKHQPKQYMYAPSSAVWGNCEFSLSGGGAVVQTAAAGLCHPTLAAVGAAVLLPPGDDDAVEQQRHRLQYHLCQLFPEAAVLAVMGAHPKETNAQRLCQRIIAFQKGFADGEEREKW